MKIIERYLSAYVVGCLYGFPDNEHTEYVFQVLRETGSSSTHPVLSKVLDYVRQSDPANTKIQEEVRAYAIAMATNPLPTPEPEPEYEGRLSVHNGFVFVRIYYQGDNIGVGIAMEADKEKAIKELRQSFPDIRIVQE